MALFAKLLPQDYKNFTYGTVAGRVGCQIWKSGFFKSDFYAKGLGDSINDEFFDDVLFAFGWNCNSHKLLKLIGPYQTTTEIQKFWKLFRDLLTN